MNQIERYDPVRTGQLVAENAELQQALATAQQTAQVFAGLLAHVVRFAFNDRCRISAAVVKNQLALHLAEEGDAVVLTVKDHVPNGEGPGQIVVAREIPK